MTPQKVLISTCFWPLRHISLKKKGPSSNYTFEYFKKTGCFVHTMGLPKHHRIILQIWGGSIFSMTFCPILLSILVLQIFHLRLEVPQASQVYWWQPEILRRFTCWGRLVVEIPLFIRVSETSQVVGRISEPSTVCRCKTCEHHGKGWIPEILKHPHYLQENAPFTACTWNLPFFEGIIWIITPQPFGTTKCRNNTWLSRSITQSGLRFFRLRRWVSSKQQDGLVPLSDVFIFAAGLR